MPDTIVQSTTSLPRTPDEIVARIDAREKDDPFGFESEGYICALPFSHAKSHLKEGTDAAKWNAEISTRESVSEEAKDYLTFFREKVEGERGLSVGRAVSHFTAWKWLLGHPDSDTFPGAFNSDSDGGYYQIEALEYLEKQVSSGEWDRLTSAA